MKSYDVTQQQMAPLMLELTGTSGHGTAYLALLLFWAFKYFKPLSHSIGWLADIIIVTNIITTPSNRPLLQSSSNYQIQMYPTLRSFIRMTQTVLNEIKLRCTYPILLYSRWNSDSKEKTKIRGIYELFELYFRTWNWYGIDTPLIRDSNVNIFWWKEIVDQ